MPLSFTRPPIVNGQRKIHEHDRIRHSQTTLDSPVTSKSIDNPGFRSYQFIQPAIAFVRWSSFPSGLILDAVYVIDRDLKCVTEQARKSGLAPACISNHCNSMHRSRRLVENSPEQLVEKIHEPCVLFFVVSLRKFVLHLARLNAWLSKRRPIRVLPASKNSPRHFRVKLDASNGPP